jgi:hypothetical protein
MPPQLLYKPSQPRASSCLLNFLTSLLNHILPHAFSTPCYTFSTISLHMPSQHLENLLFQGSSLASNLPPGPPENQFVRIGENNDTEMHKEDKEETFVLETKRLRW